MQGVGVDFVDTLHDGIEWYFSHLYFAKLRPFGKGSNITALFSLDHSV